MAAAFNTGDSADMMSSLELRWYIDVLDGVPITPNSGKAGVYEGVQVWAESTFAYHPEDPANDPYGVYGFPTLPGMLQSAVSQTVESVGLSMPWYCGVRQPRHRLPGCDRRGGRPAALRAGRPGRIPRPGSRSRRTSSVPGPRIQVPSPSICMPYAATSAVSRTCAAYPPTPPATCSSPGRVHAGAPGLTGNAGAGRAWLHGRQRGHRKDLLGVRCQPLPAGLRLGHVQSGGRARWCGARRPVHLAAGRAGAGAGAEQVGHRAQPPQFHDAGEPRLASRSRCSAGSG